MKRTIIIAALALLFGPAAAAQQAAPQTIDQRIGAQIGSLVIQNEALKLENEQLRAMLKAAQDRAKAPAPAADDKPEPKN